ncbi:MAG: hypothetical protein IJ071_04605 [Ruminococcus sp.]|nr:hypothetical protein [Ruminococcus sp.]
MKTGTKLIIGGALLMLIGAGLAFLLMRRLTEGVGIIGGADAPTFIFVVTHGTVRIAGLLLAGGGLLALIGLIDDIKTRI